MSLMGLPLLLVLLLGQTVTEKESPRFACPDKIRVDLSVRTSVPIPEVCISPGQLTGFLFDRQASVDLQEEIRFGEVLRGRMGLSFVPPTELAPGERLRLTVHFAQDPLEQRVTFMLVASPGQATHQVDVFHDARSRESLWWEIEEERMKNQQLRAENQALREESTASSALRRAFLSKELSFTGIHGRPLSASAPWSASGRLTFIGGASFRTVHRVAVWLMVRNSGVEPWKMATASLTDEQGEPLKQLDFGHVRTLLPLETADILVEASSEHIRPLTSLTLTLSDEVPRSLTVPLIPLP